jgi:hypothetical protein
VVLPRNRSHGWYDFSVKADGSSAEARYAGQVETGTPGFSDPLMGGGIVQTTSSPENRGDARRCAVGRIPLTSTSVNGWQR